MRQQKEEADRQRQQREQRTEAILSQDSSSATPRAKPILHLNGRADSLETGIPGVKHVHFGGAVTKQITPSTPGDDSPVVLESMDHNEIQPLEELTGMTSLRLNPNDLYADTLRAKQNRQAINEAMEKQRASLSPQPMPTPVFNQQFQAQTPQMSSSFGNNASPTPRAESNVRRVPVEYAWTPKKQVQPHNQGNGMYSPPISKPPMPQPQQAAHYFTLPSRGTKDAAAGSAPRQPIQVKKVPVVQPSAQGPAGMRPVPVHDQRRVAQTPPPTRPQPLHIHTRSAATPPPNLGATPPVNFGANQRASLFDMRSPFDDFPGVLQGL